MKPLIQLAPESHFILLQNCNLVQDLYTLQIPIINIITGFRLTFFFKNKDGKLNENDGVSH